MEDEGAGRGLESELYYHASRRINNNIFNNNINDNINKDNNNINDNLERELDLCIRPPREPRLSHSIIESRFDVGFSLTTCIGMSLIFIN